MNRITTSIPNDEPRPGDVFISSLRGTTRYIAVVLANPGGRSGYITVIDHDMRIYEMLFRPYSSGEKLPGQRVNCPYQNMSDFYFGSRDGRTLIVIRHET